MRFRCLAGIHLAGSKSRTSPPMRHFCCETSNSVIGPMPERPATAFSQMASTPMPMGVTPPSPVITTRFTHPPRQARGARSWPCTSYPIPVFIQTLEGPCLVWRPDASRRSEPSRHLASDVDLVQPRRALHDELETRRNIASHQRLNGLLGRRRVGDTHAEQRGPGGRGGGLVQRPRVHLAEPLEALHLHPVPTSIHAGAAPFLRGAAPRRLA